MHEDSVPFSQRTYCVSIGKTYWLVLCRPAVAIYCVNYTDHVNTLYEQNADFFIGLRRRGVPVPVVTYDVLLSQAPPSYYSITGDYVVDGDIDGGALV
jgi:hypothetical protein